MTYYDWFGVLLCGAMAVELCVEVVRVLRRRKKKRDIEFLRGAAKFAKANGGWPCRDCIRSGYAGFCTHRTPYEDGPQ